MGIIANLCFTLLLIGLITIDVILVGQKLDDMHEDIKKLQDTRREGE